jgi:hypothetical protein
MHIQGVFAKNCFCISSLPAEETISDHLLFEKSMDGDTRFTGYHGNNYPLLTNGPAVPQNYCFRITIFTNICYVTEESAHFS